MTFLTAMPAWARSILWLLVVVVVIILVAMIVHAMGGFRWDLRIGHFRLLIGVS